ncbi:hypothetical protein AN958_02447 [Leucoagaricus sp. SymC.cos]|nr:hypothetical protein AN958_02447 [Leucoagaricus sp. SymC.cos]
MAASVVQDMFMLFGDSITQGAWEPGLNGFGQRLSHVYSRSLDVINRGYSGYNTEWALPLFEQFFPKREDKHAPRVQLLTVWFGANDSCILPSIQHLPLERFKENLRKIIDIVKSPESVHYSPWTRVMLLTPPPVNTHQRAADLESRDPPLALDRLFDTTKLYAEAVQEVGAEKGVPVVDVWQSLWNAANNDEASLGKYLTDGLHLSGAGYEIVYNLLIETIKEKCPEIYYENLRPTFPLWRDINYENPSETLYAGKPQTN